MSFNLIDLIKEQLSPELVSKLANQLGESESGIAKAISGLLPVVVGGLAEKSSDKSVLDLVTSPEIKNVLGDLLGSNSNSGVSNLIQSIFGEKLSSVLGGISSFSGVEAPKVNSLLGVVTGASVGSVNKLASENNLDVNGISNLLNSQKEQVSSLLPAGLSLGALGLGGFFSSFDGFTDKISDVAGDVVDKVGDVAGDVADKIGDVAGSVAGTVGSVASNVGDKVEDLANDVTDAAKNGGSSLLKWLIPLALLLLGGWFIFNKCGKKNDSASTGVTTAVTDSTATTTDSLTTATATTATTSAGVGAERTLEEIDLNGTKLKAYAGGLESQIISFLKDGNYAKASDEELKDKWYSFDNVNFVFGKSDEITAESKDQLNNLAVILKAYPDAKIKIGGYTDKKGDEAGNLKISQLRADFIKAELTKLGVEKQIVGAEGYGEKFATVDENASDEERKADRKMSIRFVK